MCWKFFSASRIGRTAWARGPALGLAVVLLGAGASALAQQPDDPFRLSLRLDSTNGGQTAVLSATWSMPAGHYLYADRIKVDVPEGVGLFPLAAPAPVVKTDSFSGEKEAMFEHEVTLAFRVSPVPQPLAVSVHYQGCGPNLCFLPQTRRFALTMRAAPPQPASAAQASETTADKKQVQVVTTIFPLYDWAKAVGGERVAVFQLLPPGVEAHTFAPKPSDVFRLNQTDVFINLGKDMEPWAEDLLKGLDNRRLVAIEAGKGVAHAAEAEHEKKGRGDTDPHIWLDPVLAQPMVSAIAEGLAQADPAGRDVYLSNAAEYNASLRALHERIANGLRNCRHKQILYGGHFAFGYFARRYGLTHLSPYPGFSPNAAPKPAQIITMIQAIKQSGQTTLFHEELLDPKVGRIIVEETGVKLVLLHGAHNLTKEERARGNVTYLSIMEENLSKLRLALDAQ